MYDECTRGAACRGRCRECLKIAPAPCRAGMARHALRARCTPSIPDGGTPEPHAARRARHDVTRTQHRRTSEPRSQSDRRTRSGIDMVCADQLTTPTEHVISLTGRTARLRSGAGVAPRGVRFLGRWLRRPVRRHERKRSHGGTLGIRGPRVALRPSSLTARLRIPPEAGQHSCACNRYRTGRHIRISSVSTTRAMQADGRGTLCVRGSPGRTGLHAA